MYMYAQYAHLHLYIYVCVSLPIICALPPHVCGLCVLCVVLCVTAGLLMAPGIRYGRLLQSLLEPPVWAFNFRPRAAVRLMAQGGFALQLLLTLLWISATTDVLRLSAGSLAWLRGVMMLCVALIQTWTVPYLLQVCVLWWWW